MIKMKVVGKVSASTSKKRAPAAGVHTWQQPVETLIKIIIVPRSRTNDYNFCIIREVMIQAVDRTLHS